MKKIATLLLFLFTLVQAGPAVSALFADNTSILIVDEENGVEKVQEAKKYKNDIFFTSQICIELSHQINTALHVAEKIEAHPCLEKLTPPPNFC